MDVGVPSPIRTLRLCLLPCLLPLLPAAGRAEFHDEFDATALDGWFFFTGDGAATMEFVPQPTDGFARIQVDATRDAHNVWWAIIKRDVSAALDLERLHDPAYELRVEARVRPSHAPRRVNFMINTQRTTDFHEHLREYDLAHTGWHTISMTTRNLDAGPGDTVFVQLGVTDWGPGTYHVDVDYYRAEVVRRDAAAPDVGEPLVYHPAVPELATFTHHLPVTHDSIVTPEYPQVNFNDWQLTGGPEPARVLTVAPQLWPVLRWDFSVVQGRRVAGAGVLELTTATVAKGGAYTVPFGEDLGGEFGKIRVIEILSGDPRWEQTTVTYDNLLSGGAAEDVFNSQMIFDLELEGAPGAGNHVTIPRPVMQRLLDGRTKGLLIRPLGALAASVYASEDPNGRGPVLHFTTE